MNYKQDLITDGPRLSIQACDDGVWLHFTTFSGKRNCSINLPVKFAKGTHLYDSVICQWADDFAKKHNTQEDDKQDNPIKYKKQIILSMDEAMDMKTIKEWGNSFKEWLKPWVIDAHVIDSQ